MTARRLAALVGAIALGLMGSACSSGNYPVDLPDAPAVSGAPAPVKTAGLSTLAGTIGSGQGLRLALHTTDGDVTFWSGVNLGSTIPGHNPGELAASATDYRRWLADMGRFGVRFVRIYTILPPAFYAELLAYNRAHEDAPLYLIQGVYLPDESYIETGDLLDPVTTAAFTTELGDASAAVSGDLTRPASAGRASGTWSADVSPWLSAWIIGAELDPGGIERTDAKHAGAPAFSGRYFASDAAGSPTEHWLAARMDELATAEAGRGRSEPIAFVNWPTTDPLTHPAEANPREDAVTIDANMIRATDAWPGGTFASYHVYPYYPDFLRYEPRYQQTLVDGTPDAYAGYLTELKDHHLAAGLPTMVTEFGVPSSLGSAHFGTNGRDQGFHSEQEALAMDAQMLRTIKDVGLAGALLFIWSDEWFKFTWNTFPRFGAVDSERRALWHDPLTNEQFFGIVAQDPVSSGWRTPYESATGIQSVAFDTDPSYAHVRVRFEQEPTNVTLAFDVVPGGAAPPGSSEAEAVADVAIAVDIPARTADAFVRSEIDPILLDGLQPEDLPPAETWSLQRMSASRSWPAADGREARPAEFVDIGHLVEGTWDPNDAAYDSRATWHWADNTLDLRIPWSMLNIADPSSKTAYIPVDGVATPVPVDAIGVRIDDGLQPPVSLTLDWEGWQRPAYSERIKVGADVIAQALRDTAQIDAR